MVVVEHPERFDHVGDGHAPVANQQQVLAVLGVGGGGEVVGPEVHARRRLVEVDDDEFVVHADAAAAGRLRFERLGHIAGERRRTHRRDVAVRLLHVEAAHLSIGDAVHEDLGVRADFLDRVENRSGRLVEKRERVQEARRRLPADVVGNRRERGVLLRVRRKGDAGVDPRQPDAGPHRRWRAAETRRVAVVPVVVEGVEE